MTIDMIHQEGEGAHSPPFSSGKQLAHYFQFAQMFWERKIVPCGSNGWGFCGYRIRFPQHSDIYDMAIVPSGGLSAALLKRDKKAQWTGPERRRSMAGLGASGKLTTNEKW